MMDIEFLSSIKETIIMVIIPTISAIVFGLPLGALLYFTNNKGLTPNKYLYFMANIYVNTVRSIPFLIFVILLIPFTRIVFNTAFGVIPASFPICFVAIALYSRFVEQSFFDVDIGVVNLAVSMKASNIQIVRHFLIVESISSLILGLTSTIISIISYSTVMGIVGGGGLGDYAIRYGYYEYNYQMIYKAVFVIILLVFIIQFIGNKLAKYLDKKKG